MPLALRCSALDLYATQQSQNDTSKKYSILFGTASQIKLNGLIYNEYEFGRQKLLNKKALYFSLKASIIQKLYLNPNGFSSRLVSICSRMAFFPLFRLQPPTFYLKKWKILSKIWLFLKPALHSIIHHKRHNKYYNILNSNISKLKYTKWFKNIGGKKYLQMFIGNDNINRTGGVKSQS